MSHPESMQTRRAAAQSQSDPARLPRSHGKESVSETTKDLVMGRPLVSPILPDFGGFPTIVGLWHPIYPPGTKGGFLAPLDHLCHATAWA